MDSVIIKETHSLIVHTDLYVQSMQHVQVHIYIHKHKHTPSASVFYMGSYSEKIVAMSLG